jgi:hypothetical protein
MLVCINSAGCTYCATDGICKNCAIYDACVCRSMCEHVALVYTDMHLCRVFGWLACVQVWVGVHITKAGASFKRRSDWGCI